MVKRRLSSSIKSESKNSKGFLEISFAWLFALIVGAFVLFLAVFFAMKLMSTEQLTDNVATAKDIGVLLNPLETGFESGGRTLLDLSTETRIYSRCSEDGLGSQRISVSEMNFGKWSEEGIEVSVKNRYIFSENPSEGEKFNVLTLPFEFPFKVADLTILIPGDQEYCFVDPPEEFFEIFSDLGFDKTKVRNVSSIQECGIKSKKFCFETSCQNATTIHRLTGYVSKGKNMYYETDSLMYAAIFSDANNYECQVKRLMARTESLSNLYNEKANFISDTGCRSNVANLLTGFSTKVRNVKENPDQIQLLSRDIENLKNSNDRRGCPLW